MFDFARKYTITCIAILIATALWLLTFFTHLEIFEFIVNHLERLEAYQIDELVVGAVIVCIGITFDLILVRKRKAEELKISEQRLRVMKATMRTVHDIVGNAFNEMILFQIQAKESHALSPETLKELDNLIQETCAKLKEISDLDDTPEKEFSSGMTIIDTESRKRNSEQ
ncbi:hypothetical protein [Rubellicoccus peritrichatus]|uniref:Uncharacterized protein n=1 Tax=Rubellicoccus peritrichatus TaxID=3080537 RepID=A0AAQ3LB60_9BACT|nr:hypothetical protein [Puniceicoccus sp. CR14]WOO40690.1 hypothetical protein RZN69_18875 [Puniceicoccus sp. CR14]